jgi:hypothetical protein
MSPIIIKIQSADWPNSGESAIVINKKKLLALEKISPLDDTAVFCIFVLWHLPSPSPHPPPPPLTLHLLSVNLSVRGVGGVVTPPHEPKPPPQTLPFSLAVCGLGGRGWLKIQCHETFDFWFFTWISFPQVPEYTIRTVSNFSENLQRYLQLKVHHRCRWHQWQMQKNLQS